MNKEEYYKHNFKKPKVVINAFKQWKKENSLTCKCVIHHRDDTEETLKYNSEYYELWGCDLDGSFEYGKYVVFMTQAEHSAYHNKGEKNPNYGKSFSEEYCAKLSANNSHYWKDKNFSEEHCAKLSANHSHYWKGKQRSEETLFKMSTAKKGMKVLYTTYKDNGGTLKWNDFCHAVKNGEITFELQPITVYTK